MHALWKKSRRTAMWTKVPSPYAEYVLALTVMRRARTFAYKPVHVLSCERISKVLQRPAWQHGTVGGCVEHNKSFASPSVMYKLHTTYSRRTGDGLGFHTSTPFPQRSSVLDLLAALISKGHGLAGEPVSSVPLECNQCCMNLVVQSISTPGTNMS